MRFASRIAACSFAALLAACGGGGGTVTPPPAGNLPSVVTISPAGSPSAVAYRIGGSGSWTSASTSTTTQFTVPVGTTTYSVAYACNGTYETDQTVMNLGVTDTLTVPASCYLGPGCGCAVPSGPARVFGTFDATAVGATSVLVSATYDQADVSVASGAGSFSNLVTDTVSQTFVLAAKNAAGDVVGFKSLHGMTPPPFTIPLALNFPPLTAADAAVSEPFTVTGGIGSSRQFGVAYLLDGTNNGFEVTNASGTSYAGVPAADWGTSDSYGVFVKSFDSAGNDYFGTFHLGRTTATAPVAVTLPALSHIAINHADLSFPLTYNGFSASDVAKGYVYAEFDGSTPPEYDVATPAYLAGKTSYGPPSFAGQTGFVTKTAANVTWAQYAVVGLSFQPSSTATGYLGGYPPAGQSVEAYLSIYAPGSVPGSAPLRLRLMKGDRVPVGILQP